MPDAKPTAFHDLPPSDFPFTINFISAATGEPLHQIVVDSPGAVTVPGRDKLGEPVGIEMTFPDGRWVRVDVDGKESHGRS